MQKTRIDEIYTYICLRPPIYRLLYRQPRLQGIEAQEATCLLLDRDPRKNGSGGARNDRHPRYACDVYAGNI